MWKPIACGLVAAAGMFLLLSPAKANKNFPPDWTFKGSSIASFKSVGDADWRAENGEIIGTPKSAEGGWLLLDRPLQDVQFAATYRCTGGCKTGLLMRAHTTAEGMEGVFVSLPDGQNAAGSFNLKLDPKGHEVKRDALPGANGTVRQLAPPGEGGRGGAGGGGGRGAAGGPAGAPGAARGAVGGPGGPGAPAGPGGPAGGGAPGAAGGRRGGGGGGGAMPEGSPIQRPVFTYAANEWNPLEVILDVNYLRVWVNDGPEGGTTNGRADDQMTAYGPVALYVGGTGEVRFKQIEQRDINKRVLPNEQVSSHFRKQQLNDYYMAWSVAVADVNKDGVNDILAGPYYYLGPDYQTAHEIYVAQFSKVGSDYAPAAVNFAFDYTGDGWPDYVVATGRAMVMYVNPKGENRRWEKYNVLPTISAEVAVFKDVDGDGRPDCVFVGGGTTNWAGVDPKDPTATWKVHAVSTTGFNVVAQHGIGAGDVNGDGRVDIVSPYGWWEQPTKGTPEGLWQYHPVSFARWPRAGGSPGGAEMSVYDVNGDGLNDVVTSLGAHGFGLAWYEQKKDHTFVQHMIMDDYTTKNPGNVTFSELHAMTAGDIDGDGIPDIVVGKRVHAHSDSYTDPDPNGPPVLYVFKTVRNPKAPGGAEFKPELIHNRSGVGSTVTAFDVNKDGVMDVLTSTDRGTFVFWGKKAGAPAAAASKAGTK